MSEYQTQLLNYPDDEATIVSLLQRGECVALPTETVYGLAAKASDPNAVAKIFTAKGRPNNHPLIVHIDSVERLPQWAQNIPDIAYELAAEFWPGPLSLLLDKHPQVPSEVTGGKQTIVLRVPSHPVFLSVLAKTELGLAAPSANRYKSISPTKSAHVLRSLDERIAGVVDGGSTQRGIESTILDVTGDTLKILRPGPISADEISRVTGREVVNVYGCGVGVPGSVKQHYQPTTPARVVETLELARLGVKSENVGLISYSPLLANCPLNVKAHQHLSSNPSEYATSLYDALHTLDVSGCDEIWIEALPHTSQWDAVNDRVSRAVARS